MKIDWSEPGFIVSGAGHAAILLAAVVGLSTAKPFEDAQEAVAVEVVTAEELRAITRGERRADSQVPTPPRVDRVAETPVESESRGEATREAPAPPPRAPDPTPEARPEQKRVEVAATPPQRPEPEPPKVDPPKPEPQRAAPTPPEPPKPESPQPLAEERPEPAKSEPKPAPPKPEPPKPQPPRKVVERPKPVEKPKPVEAQKPKPSPAREHGETNFNPDAISRLLQSRDKPQQTGSAGRELQRQAALGAPRGQARKLSLSQRDALVGIIAEQLRSCWSAPPAAETARGMVPRIRLALNTDGSLSAQPILINPRSDPTFRAIADSALRATRRCSPFRIPAQFQPYYEEWKSWVVDFDPKDMLG